MVLPRFLPAFVGIQDPHIQNGPKETLEQTLLTPAVKGDLLSHCLKGFRQLAARLLSRRVRCFVACCKPLIPVATPTQFRRGSVSFDLLDLHARRAVDVTEQISISAAAYGTPAEAVPLVPKVQGRLTITVDGDVACGLLTGPITGPS